MWKNKALQTVNQWIIEQGLPPGELSYNLVHDDSNEVLAIFDLAWPSGLQEGYSHPVTLLLDEGQEIEERANQAGFRFFTNIEQFKAYVNHEILAMEVAA